MITETFFGLTAEADKVYCYEIKNSKSESVKILNLGGTIQALNIKNKSGILTDVSLGYDSVSGYENNSGYLGALIGRYANRIAKGKFTLNGKEYTLYNNNGNNHLHGGKKGYDKRIWQTKINGNKLELSLFSHDGEEGYPSDLNITVTYSFSDQSELNIEYISESGGDTIINLTNHCYFNLNGGGDILSHYFKINSSYYTPTDSESIPTGEIESVTGTPFDFTRFKQIGKDINCSDIQLLQANGYDHNYVFSEGFKKVCEVYSKESGILMEVLTDNEGLQLYSGNYLTGVKGKSGKKYNFRNGFCLETQSFPDSPNKPHFPSPVLKKGEIYKHKTIYKFSRGGTKIF